MLKQLYNLTADACTGTCRTSPFGQVDLHQTVAGSVAVTVSLFNGDKFIDTGAHHTFTFDVAGAATITGVTSGYTADAAASYSQPGFGGTFPYSIECTGCGPGASRPVGGTLSFTVTEPRLNEASFISDGSAFFTEDILGNNGKTGAVGAPGPAMTIVPEPATITLLGTGLLALIGLGGCLKNAKMSLLRTGINNLQRANRYKPDFSDTLPSRWGKRGSGGTRNGVGETT